MDGAHGVDPRELTRQHFVSWLPKLTLFSSLNDEMV
jgi:hypothetical protein